MFVGESGDVPTWLTYTLGALAIVAATLGAVAPQPFAWLQHIYFLLR